MAGISEVTSYKCDYCGELYERELSAIQCAFNHAKENLANALLKEGYTLESIDYKCGFNWKLSEEQKKVTKDNCFILSWWQCCNAPAYRIVAIDSRGALQLWGKGAWSGYYGGFIILDALPKPHDKEELYIWEEKQ